MKSNNTVIRVEKISKCYRIGLKEELPDTFVKNIFDFIKSPLINYRKYRSLYKFGNVDPDSDINSDLDLHDILWALKNVSLEVKRGEVLGIIGRNGAGKSTLLKILSKITSPTSGYAEMHGRVSSLLEVGTGFHPELTGRENIYLNGTILGMRKWELDRKFEEIVEFSGVKKFIDTPVKRYSSGMTVRLAFSVAAHLEPEILIIDEVLSVGDATFQKKCLNKMENVSNEGRTIIFVSHSMPAIGRLCDRAVCLDEGRLIHSGPTYETISKYLDTGLGTTAERKWLDSKKAPGSNIVRLHSVRLISEDGNIVESLDIRKPVGVQVEYEVLESGHALLCYFNFENIQSVKVFDAYDTGPEWRDRPRPKGYFRSIAWIPGNFLSEGLHYVSIALLTLQPVDTQCWVPEAVAFHVIDSLDGDTARGVWVNEMDGAVRPLLKWETQYTPS